MPIPSEFRVGSKPAKQSPATEWLLRTSEKIGNVVTDGLREVVAEGVKLVHSSNESVDLATNTRSECIEDLTRSWSVCDWNYLNANAYSYNEPARIGRNNCYCFAADHSAGIRDATPGRRGGYDINAYTPIEVRKGLLADGWKTTCPGASSWTTTIACVVWPNWDFHFYRLVTTQHEGSLWGHKRGATAARYTDECGQNISWDKTPENICREDYTDFCGYFYGDHADIQVA
jgi:hypothetical protein